MSSKLPVDPDILESYVLGLCSPEQTSLIDQLRRESPAVQDEIRSLQAALETLSTSYRQSPPAGLKAKTWARVQHSIQTQAQNDRSSSSASVTQETSTASATPSTAPKPKTTLRSTFLSISAAQLVLGSLLCLSIATSLYFFRSTTQLRNEAQKTNAHLSVLHDSIATLHTELRVSAREFQFRNSPHTLSQPLLNPNNSREIVARLYLNPDDTLRYVALTGVQTPDKSSHLILWSLSGQTFIPIHNCTKSQPGKLVAIESSTPGSMFLLTREQSTTVHSPDKNQIVGISHPQVLRKLLAKQKSYKDPFIAGEAMRSYKRVK